VDPQKYLVQIPDANSVNHLVVFLTSPLPAHLACSIHLEWPDKPWVLLGMISNEKPSAIFKIGRKLEQSTTEMLVEEMLVAKLGISIDSLENVLLAMSSIQSPQLPLHNSDMSISNALVTTHPKTHDAPVLASKILENFYNYCTSFATTTPNGTILFGKDMNTSFIPIKAFQDWFANTQRKLQMNPHYFEQLDNNKV